MGWVELWGKYWAAAQDQGFIFVCLLMVVLFAAVAVVSFLVYAVWSIAQELWNDVRKKSGWW